MLIPLKHYFYDTSLSPRRVSYIIISRNGLLEQFRLPAHPVLHTDDYHVTLQGNEGSQYSPPHR